MQSVKLLACNKEMIKQWHARQSKLSQKPCHLSYSISKKIWNICSWQLWHTNHMLWIVWCMKDKGKNGGFLGWSRIVYKTGMHININEIRDWNDSVYLFILKSISRPNFNYFNKLWILMSCNGLEIYQREAEDRVKRAIPLNRTLNTSSQSSFWLGMVQDMLVLTWTTVYLKTRWNLRTKT